MVKAPRQVPKDTAPTPPTEEERKQQAELQAAEKAFFNNVNDESNHLSDLLLKRALSLKLDDQHGTRPQAFYSTCSAVFLTNRSALLLLRGNAPHALVDASYAIEIDPKYPLAYHRRGMALLSLKQPAEAKAAFSAGLRLAPDHPALLAAYRLTKDTWAIPWWVKWIAVAVLATLVAMHNPKVQAAYDASPVSRVVSWAHVNSGLAPNSYYDVLGIHWNSTIPEVKKAYRNLARTEHPDKRPQQQQAEATVKWVRISHAYEVLSDSKSKAAYDEHLMPEFSLSAEDVVLFFCSLVVLVWVYDSLYNSIFEVSRQQTYFMLFYCTFFSLLNFAAEVPGQPKPNIATGEGIWLFASTAFAYATHLLGYGLGFRVLGLLFSFVRLFFSLVTLQSSPTSLLNGRFMFNLAVLLSLMRIAAALLTVSAHQ